jgi:hypothetical protein
VILQPQIVRNPLTSSREMDLAATGNSNFGYFGGEMDQYQQ